MNPLLDPIERLIQMGYRVEILNRWHVLVEGEIDFFYPRGKMNSGWYDRITKDRGRKPLDQIPLFIARRLIERKQCEEICKEKKLNQDS